MTRALDGDGWQIRPHLGLEAALAAATGAAQSSEVAAGAIHPDHAATDVRHGWLPASVPGSVLDDCRRAGAIPDPYFERNSLVAEWVPARAWTYRRTVDIPMPRPGVRHWLRLDGIDPAGHVFLDGVRIADHDSMYAPLEVEITEQLSGDRSSLGAGWHELAVVVEPAPPNEPQVGRTSRVRVHRPRMNEGWDFCPRLRHQGLWRSVSLITAGPVRIVDVWVRPSLDVDLAAATVDVVVDLDRATGDESVVRLDAAFDGRPVATASIADGRRATLVFRVERPSLWWPNGLGEPALHDVTVTMSIGREMVDERSVRIGIRRIERRANAGASGDARPWTFVVNGRPLEVRGWNWVPIDAMYGVPRPDRLDHLLRLAAASGSNLVRVWGGGLIETEAFYDACDRLGLLIWQEFTQSSSGIDNAPATDRAFVELIRRDAEAIVALRRNHASLAIWCGGNELQDDVGPLEDDRSPVLAALHEVVERLDPGRIWLPTSPSGPRFHNRLADIDADPNGLHDVHGPWEHQGLREQWTLWNRGTSLFNGEFGAEGMTNRRAHDRLVGPSHREPADRSNPVYRHLGDWWINADLVRAAFAGRIETLEQLRRASQHLQADGLRTAIEANRRRWPRNTGSIPWQLNESFPNAWCTSVVDHGGEPKPAFYAVGRAFAATAVVARLASSVLDGAPCLNGTIWAWSRDGAVEAGRVRWRVVDVSGSTVADGAAPVDLDGGGSIEACAIEVDVSTADSKLVLLDLALDDATGREQAANRYLVSRTFDLGPVIELAPATVAVETSVPDASGSSSLTISHRGGPAAIGVVVADARRADAPGWAELTDNGFDLLPGESRLIGVRWIGAPPDEAARLSVEAWNVPPVAVA